MSALTKNVRFVTAPALFDGHDATINIMRRIIQDSGEEVIHLGHNRSVEFFMKATKRKRGSALKRKEIN